jgi:hypothetical protein
MNHVCDECKIPKPDTRFNYAFACYLCAECAALLKHAAGRDAVIMNMLGGPFMLDTHGWPVWGQSLFAGILMLGAIVTLVRNW